MFKALLLDKPDGQFACTVAELDETRLPAGDVLVQPEYSTLNYKDALALTNKAPVVRNWPMVPGIDGAGVVLESSHADWKPGDRFVHNGWGVGETHWGCLAAARAPEGRLAGQAAGRLHGTPGDGDRHGGLHRDAVRAGAGAQRPEAAGRRGAGDRGHRRRRQRGHRAAFQAGLPRQRGQRQACRRRTT